MTTSQSSPVLESSPWSGRIFNGEWVAAKGGSIDIKEPASGKLLGRAGLADATDVSTAARAAAQAQPAWAATPVRERCEVLFRAAAYLQRHSEELAAFIARETGGTFLKAMHEVREAQAQLKAAASLALQPDGVTLPSTPGRLNVALRLPLGVIGVISPFNFPLILSMRAVAPALAVGNAVVLKPDAQTPVTGGVILALAFGFIATNALAEAPKTVIHLVTVAFKADARPEKIQAALDGAQKLPSQYKGITRVWTKALNVQNVPEAKVKKTHLIAMEFVDEAALKAYANSDAQKKWYELYLPIREQSTTFDVTN